MASFHFNLRNLLGDREAPLAVSHRTLRALNLVDEPDEASGPGWFGSSWDLVRGLDVREGLPLNPSVNEWLMFQLS